MKDNLENNSLDLPTPKLFEAGIFFATNIVNKQGFAQVNEELRQYREKLAISADDIDKALMEIADNQEQAAEAVRLLLSLGKATGYSSEVQEAIEGAGKKQGVVELALLSTLVLCALIILVTHLRKDETHTKTTRFEDDKIRFEIKEEHITHYYSPSEFVGRVLKEAIAPILKIPSTGEQEPGDKH